MVLVGRVRRAFGLKGELVVQPSTNEPGAVFAPGRRVYTATSERTTTASAAHAVPRECTVESSRPFKDAWLVKFDCIADKTAADLWRGVQFEAPLDELAPPAENEFYEHELVGLSVTEETHGAIGVVAGWYEVPQGLVLEVRGAEWRADVPFNEAFVTRVDRDTRSIHLTLPDGLLERAGTST